MKISKYIIIFLIGLVLYFIFTSLTKKEGFSVESQCQASLNQYAYLAPIPKNDTWSETTWKSYIQYLNKVNHCPNGTTPVKYKLGGEEIEGVCTTYPPSGYLTTLPEIITDPEAQFVAKYNIYPYGSNLLNKIKNLIKQECENSNSNNDNSCTTATEQQSLVTQIQQSFPSRFIYDMYFSQSEEKETPQSVSYQIYSGAMAPPASSISISGIECSLGNIL